MLNSLRSSSGVKRFLDNIEKPLEEESFVLNRRKFFFITAGALLVPKTIILKPPSTEALRISGYIQRGEWPPHMSEVLHKIDFVLEVPTGPE
jgi:hypothetical protein